ncbi:unnamed protein product [Rotaria magnacalcarata]|uniref:C2 domain-containing protein n=1 Tax=Rotaria magnacalcarata TaxID=392030 RepID=A0A816PQY0_9BILA|nr:unnamed protein product [Rotaria magnacalcarata]
MSSSAPPADSLLTNPFVNTITGYLSQMQERNTFTQQRIHINKHHFLIAIGFLVLLYFLIHIQILFFWLLEFIFRLLFQIISAIFWLPLSTARFFIPKTIDYDILFPLFWLCSISSFYISKFSHENICQFYDEYFVRRYKILQYDQTKREEVKRHLFVATFIVLLLLQSLFILIPIASSIRRHNSINKVPSQTPSVDKQMTTKTSKSSTAQPTTEEAVETTNENLYTRFIDAFKDDDETQKNENRQPSIDDEKPEHTLKTIKNEAFQSKSKDQQKANDDGKSSRFQRWIVHYLKAPFQKWNNKNTIEVITTMAEDDFEDDSEEEDIELDSSSSSSFFDEDETDDEDDENNEQLEHSTKTEQIQESFGSVKNFGQKLNENVKSKISSTEEEEEEEEEDDDDDEDSLSLQEYSTKPIEITKTIGARITKKISSVIVDDDNNELGYDSDDEEEKLSSILTKKIKTTLVEHVRKAKKAATTKKNKIAYSTENKDDEQQSKSIARQVKKHSTKKIKDLGEKVKTHEKHKVSSLTKYDKIENETESCVDQEKETTSNDVESMKDKIFTNLDASKQISSSNLVDTAKNLISNTFETLSESATEKVEQITKPNKMKSKIKGQTVEPLENEASHEKNVVSSKVGHLKKLVDGETKSLKKKRKPKSLVHKTIKEKLLRNGKKKKTTPSVNKLKSKLKIKKQLNGFVDDPWNIWHLAKRKLAYIFLSSTKHARHFPRYNATSLYTAYTDLKCYDYTKQSSPYRLLNRKHHYFLDTYRHHSPFPVYLSILKSNGPRCYRHYPNCSCALTLKTPVRNVKTQLYRFIRFWAIIGVLVVILGAIYAVLINRKQTYFSLFHHQENFDGPSKNQQRTTTPNRNNLSRAIVTEQQISSSISQQTVSSNSNTRPLDQKIANHLCLWLEDEKNDGFRNLSELCRIAINSTFIKKVKFTVSMNRQAIIDAFIERHRANFNDLIDHLTLYYNKTRLHFTFLSEKTNQRYLYLSILTTFILLTIIFLIIFEYRRLLQCIQKFLKLVYSYKQYILIRIRNKYLQKRTPSLLNALLNSKSHIREKFYNEFARSLNEELKNRKEQLSVETLQFANAKIRDVSQTANNSNGETPAEKIVINAVLDIDHLILNIVNKFKEQHFSLETPKLSGQLHVLLIINPTQYTIEANLQQLYINPVNIIDPNNSLSVNEKQSIVKVLDETINRTTVQCSFRLSDNQEDTHHTSLYNSALGSYPDSKQPHSSINQLPSSSIQTAGSRTHETASTRYQPSDSMPTVLINDSNRYIFTKDLALEKEPKRLLIRVVKAVKLHDVEQPYCILELNYPKQIKQTDIAKNGLNPFWDERFTFECNEQSNLIRLQIIDHKKSKKRQNNDYTDTVYADLSIPFSYEMSTVYKQDIQISQQYPESIIRLEVSIKAYLSFISSTVNMIVNEKNDL